MIDRPTFLDAVAQAFRDHGLTAAITALIGGSLAIAAAVTRRAFTNEAMLERLEHELSAERERIDKQRAEDRRRAGQDCPLRRRRDWTPGHPDLGDRRSRLLNRRSEGSHGRPDPAPRDHLLDRHPALLHRDPVRMGIDRHARSERRRSGHHRPQSAASDIGLRHRSIWDMGLPRIRDQRRSGNRDLAARRVTAAARKQCRINRTGEYND